MPLQRTYNVSFPRSGHHMTRDVLQLYFGDELKFCEWHHEFRKRPEVCPETNFTKVHDFYLTHPIEPDKFKYLVLVRHPVYSIASWRIHHRDEIGDMVENQDTSRWKVEFWAKWFNKWVMSDIPNRLIVQYESLIQHPAESFSKVIWFLSEESVDSNRLAKAVESVNPRAGIPNTTDNWIGWI